MSYLIRINEFSRKFSEPRFSDRGNKYVTDGFNKEVGFQTADVPSEIQEAIYQNMLRVNDNYPLKPEETALIAREIGQYSILAVITCATDSAMRPIHGCRYFWLKNADTDDFDGIGTLLKWWEEKEKPYCEIKPWVEYEREIQQKTDDYYQAIPIDTKYSEPSQQQIEKECEKIIEKPYIFSIDKKENRNLSNYWGLHALALQLNNKYQNGSIAWSWNTSVLDSPNHFTLICCADEKSYDLQKKYSSFSEQLVTEKFPKKPNISEPLVTEMFKEQPVIEEVDIPESSFPLNQTKQLKQNLEFTETSEDVKSDVQQNEPATSSYIPLLKKIIIGLLVLGIGTGGTFLINRFFLSPDIPVEETEPSSINNLEKK